MSEHGHKTESYIGMTAYRAFIVISLAAVTGLGAWNLSETHNTSVMVSKLNEHVRDRDEEVARIANVQLQVLKTLEEMREVDAKLDTRVSIIETKIKQ